MSRYFGELSYRGTNYSGWQKQDNATTIQEVIETALSTLVRKKTEVTGCGRTDAGVHATRFYLHFDYEGNLPDRMAGRLNMMLPADISFRKVFPVRDGSHARFDAVKRTYKYVIIKNKSPFQQGLAYRFYRFDKIDIPLLQEVSSMLLEYNTFFPFCKSHTDVKTMTCDLIESYWNISEEELVYHISANRFLRGMVRLIVGMCLRVATGDTKISAVRNTLNKQLRLERAWSVPADGLFLCEVEYPESIFTDYNTVV